MIKLIPKEGSLTVLGLWCNEKIHNLDKLLEKSLNCKSLNPENAETGRIDRVNIFSFMT